jgi:hypothetical protein
MLGYGAVLCTGGGLERLARGTARPGGTSIRGAKEVGTLRQSTEGQLCVLDYVLRARARRRRLRRGGLAVVTLLLVVLVVLVLDPGRQPSAGVARTGAVTATRAPVGSRAAALMLARQMLARLVVPPGSHAAHPSPVPPPLSVSSAGDALPYTVELHRFVLVREPAATVQSFLLAHVPAGMSWAGDGLGSTNTVTVLSVDYRPRSLASGLTNADLGTAAIPAADGDTLIRADASVSWFPPRSPAEQLNATSIRSVTVTATEVFPQSRTATRTVTSPLVIGRLVALVDSLPATPYPDVAMSCAPGGTAYRLDFTPGVVIRTGGCGGSDAITVHGKEQPRLWDQGALIAAARQLLHLTT